MKCPLCSGEAPRSQPSQASTVPGVPGATVRLDKDGFMDIREPMVVEERTRPDTSGGMDGMEDAWRFWQSASSQTQQGGELSQRLRELEEMEMDEEAEGGNSKGSVDEMLELDQIMGHYEDLPPTAAASEHEGWCRDLILWLVVPLG